jgi:hypothetical protein
LWNVRDLRQAGACQALPGGSPLHWVVVQSTLLASVPNASIWEPGSGSLVNCDRWIVPAHPLDVEVTRGDDTTISDPGFQPGFRISAVDCIVIIVCVVASTALWSRATWLAFVIAFVVVHFFAFCNVFRIARPLELAWSGVFVALMYGAIAFGMPPWSVAIGLTLLATVTVLGLQMRKPSYHGVLWERINPELPRWWSAHRGDEAEP